LIRVKRGKMLKSESHDSIKKIVEAQVIAAMQKQGNDPSTYMSKRRIKIFFKMS